MTLLELQNCLKESDRFVLRGATDDTEEAEILIWDKEEKGLWHVGYEDVLRESWEVLSEILEGKRRAKVMETFSRIVGYWSRKSNWNNSKLAEGVDRSRGNYDARSLRELELVEMPKEITEKMTSRMVCVVPA